jgi:hypothetical protein
VELIAFEYVCRLVVEIRSEQSFVDLVAAVCLQQCCDRACWNYEKILESKHSWVGNFCMRQDCVGSEANVVGGQQF